MLVTEKLKLAIRSSHQRMRLERLLSAEKSEQLTTENLKNVKNRLLESRERLEEAMARHWNVQRIEEKERVLKKMLQEAAEKSCRIDEK